MHRAALYALLSVVAAAAAVLSFSALRDLALVCGFAPALAWLLPVTVDAGAAAGSIAWLARWTPPAATAYGRTLALVLLSLSVGDNALGHGLEAYAARPQWLVVVGVSAIAPAVLGALVHLVVLMGRQPETPVGQNVPSSAPPVPPPALEPEMAEQPTVAEHMTRRHLEAVPAVQEASPDDDGGELESKARKLVADGAGRHTLVKELGIGESVARRWAKEFKPEQARA